jgi:beta-lactamase superfamily II metal-dependent hydrolase
MIVPVANTTYIDDYITSSEDLVITFMDVGHGDSIFVHYKNKTMVVDCGGYYPNYKILDYLEENNVEEIDVMVLTHNHLDHTCAYNDINRKYEINKIYTYSNLHRYDTIDFDPDIKIEVLNPPESNDYIFENDRSVVLKLTYGDFDVLLTGDVTKIAESDMIANEMGVDSDILKVAHHGSESSSGLEFINAVSPEVSIISTEFLRISLDDGVVETLQSVGSQIYTTSERGDIVVITRGDGYTISTSK